MYIGDTLQTVTSHVSSSKHILRFLLKPMQAGNVTEKWLNKRLEIGVGLALS